MNAILHFLDLLSHNGMLNVSQLDFKIQLPKLIEIVFGGSIGLAIMRQFDEMRAGTISRDLAQISETIDDGSFHPGDFVIELGIFDCYFLLIHQLKYQ